MSWVCKLCTASFQSRTHLLTHIRLQHSHYSKVSPLPCLHKDCECSFYSFNALKTHLSRYHIGDSITQEAQNQKPLVFICSICLFKQPFSDTTLFRHLRVHLKNHEVIECPYKNCQFKSNVYSSFNSHKSKNHQFDNSDYKDGLVVSQESDTTVLSCYSI